ncbi:MAG: methyl-accepting chemotaxis protein, partial [Pseudomonas sp.]
MRLKLLTNLNTLLLISVCLALGATLWWSQQALERPYQLMARYLSLSQSFQQDVAQNIHDYLASGDALRHSAATQAIGQFAGDLDSLPRDLATDLQPSLLELQDFTANDLLAAGKLAGDPQGLLLQAEREMSGALEQLAAYADSSNAGSAYYAPLFQAAQHLSRLGHARGKLVSSGRSELRSEVEHELSQLNQQAQRLNDLPLLGVSAQKSDDSTDFSALLGLDSEASSQPVEDQGIALKREFSSLLQRYPGELQRTRALIEQRQQLAGSTQAKVGALQQALAAIEPQVRAQYGQIQGQVQLLQGLMIGLILLIALTIDTIQRRLTNVLHRLVPALSAWAAGDFSGEVQLQAQTRELRDIEESLNRLRLYLVDLVGTIRGHAEQVAGSSRTLADLSSGLHSGAERQAGDTAQIRDALGELEGTILQVAGDASQAADASRDAGRAVEQGQTVIGHSLTGLHGLVGEVQSNAQAIERLAEETASIGKVLTVIRGIADQTNLLALNAA